jgi:hypothetical protein
VSRNIIKESDYIFDPTTNSLTIEQRWVRPERLMLVTNVTKNVILYNFSDSSKGFAQYEKLGSESILDPIDVKASPFDGAAGSTAQKAVLGTYVQFKVDCSQMSATDYISVMVDDYEQVVDFEDTLLDGAQKLRVGLPQSMMDTDFEYSVQPSKWEALFLTQNYPSFFPKPGGGNALQVSSIFGDGTTPKSLMTITCTVPHGLVAGNIVSVQESLSQRAEGTFAVYDTPTSYTFRYYAKGQVAGEVIYPNLTAVYAGDTYPSSHIPGGDYPGLGAYTGAINTMNTFQAVSDSGTPTSNITVTFTNPHGLFPGTPISISGTNSIDGDYYVAKVPNVRQLIFNLGRVQTSVTVPVTARIIVKSEGYIIHRPYDAGVALACVLPVPGSQTIRQTRRYFRYQAGKSVQFSTGCKFTPTYNVDSLSLNTGVQGALATVTVVTVEDHGLQAGAQILLENAQVNENYNPFNGLWTVTAVTDSNTFQYQVTLTSTVPYHDLKSAGTNIYAHAYQWYGAATRAGLFDDQNGFWFEFDGNEMYVCRRHSEKLLQGRLNVTFGSNRVVGIGTLFREQLVTNDMIVIKGSSYKIINVNSDTSLTISPAYKASTTNGVRATVTQTIRVAQDEWNLDSFDGAGPSGYTLDVTKMQMIFIDYSWYGAGTIRFGMRARNGKIVYCHRWPQNNSNQLAYQKSGNLPARYEVTTEPIQNTRMVAGASGIRGGSLGPNDTIIYIENTHDWPPTGYLWVKDDVNGEIMKYTNIGAYDPVIKAYPLTVLRRQTITYAYPDRPFTISGTSDQVTFITDSSFTGSGGDSEVAVQSIYITCSPIIQHWGSSVIMDGRYDADLLPLFTGGMTKYLSVQPGIARPLVALRVAPSVDNALGRNYGQRELLNRMQLALKSIGVQTNGAFRIDVLMNPAQFGYTNWTAAQLAVTRTNVSISQGSNQMIINDVGQNGGMTGLVTGMTITGSSSMASSFAANTTIATVQGSVITMSAAALNTVTQGGTATFTPTSGYSGIPNDWTRDIPGLNSLAQVFYFDNSGVGGGGVPNYSITSTVASSNGSSITYTTSSTHAFSVGQYITVTGFSGQTGYNVPYAPITIVPTSTQITINSSLNVAAPGGTGTITSSAPSGWVNGGDSVFSFFTENGAGANAYNSSVYDLTGIRELGNSILSGNGTVSTPGFPVGPDVLLILATNIGTVASNISARISWSEAQA